MSGHIFFAHRYYGFDDALYAAVRLISAVHHSGHSLAALRDGMPALVNTPELRFACAETRKFEVIEEVLGRLAAAGVEVDRTDGARVRTADGWWLLRASNTQDVLVARAEAGSAEALQQLVGAINEQLSLSGLAPVSLT
jgi:phosphomannomutase